MDLDAEVRSGHSAGLHPALGGEPFRRPVTHEQSNEPRPAGNTSWRRTRDAQSRRHGLLAPSKDSKNKEYDAVLGG